jgi:hypothetical protein
MRSPLFFLGMVERSFPVAGDVEQHLQENAPQALLRDLHRPDKRFQVNPFDWVRVGFHSQHVALTAGIKATVATDYRVRVHEIAPRVGPMVREDRRALRRILASDWTKAPKMAVEGRPVNPLELAKFFDP